ncbi:MULTISPECIES: hypothetical protein [unclassified Anabaena]|uniref:hypothetical protein n=1 Tax=unclassified Anabaena TaxID=2619674 RepID=UPI0039C682AB
MPEEIPTLNLSQSRCVLAEGLFTNKVAKLIQMLVNKRVSTTEIRQQAKNGNLEFPYSHGILQVRPSRQGKPGKKWRWDVIFSPISWTKISC